MLISRADQQLCGWLPSCFSQTFQLGVSSQSHDPALFSTHQVSESPATWGAPAFIGNKQLHQFLKHSHDDMKATDAGVLEH